MSYDPREDDADLYTLLNEGLALYHANKPFEAHELWEYAWGAEVGRTKLTLQVIILIAAALYKHELGNPRGSSKLLAKAKDKLDEVRSGASSWLGIDLVRLEADVARALAQSDAIARGESGDIDPPFLPRASGRDGIIYLHGFASGPSSSKANLIVPPLRAEGFSVEVPDLNEGDFEHLTITRALASVRRLLRERTLLIGSSLGGYIAALTAAKDDRVRGLVLMAPAFDFAPRMRERYGADAIELWRRRGTIEVDHYAWGGRHAIGFGLLEDAERHPPRPPIPVPAYILHGLRDDVVPAKTSEEVAARFPGKVELDLADDDHALAASAPRALEAARRLIGRLGLERQPAPADPAAVLEKLARADQIETDR